MKRAPTISLRCYLAGFFLLWVFNGFVVDLLGWCLQKLFGNLVTLVWKYGGSCPSKVQAPEGERNQKESGNPKPDSPGCSSVKGLSALALHFH